MYVFEHVHILAERLLKSFSSTVCPSVVRFTDSAQYLLRRYVHPRQSVTQWLLGVLSLRRRMTIHCHRRQGYECV